MSTVVLVLILTVFTKVALPLEQFENAQANREYNRICSFYEVTKNLFLFDMDISRNGCRVDCLTLTSSGGEYSSFFDKAIVFTHTVSDGTHCGPDSKVT